MIQTKSSRSHWAELRYVRLYLTHMVNAQPTNPTSTPFTALQEKEQNPIPRTGQVKLVHPLQTPAIQLELSPSVQSRK